MAENGGAIVVRNVSTQPWVPLLYGRIDSTIV